MKINYFRIILLVFFLGVLCASNRPLAMKSFDIEDVNNVYNRGTYMIILPYGFNEIFLATNHKSKYIENFIGDGSKYGVQLIISKENQRVHLSGIFFACGGLLCNSFYILA